MQTIAEELNVQVRKWGIHIQQVSYYFLYFKVGVPQWGIPIQQSAIMFVFEMGKPTHSEPQPFSTFILCINAFQVMLSDPKLLKKPEEKSAMGPILRVGMDYHY